MGRSQALDRAMLTAQSAGTTTAVYTPRANAAPQQTHVHTISWANGVTAGTVVIEVADSATYAGTWAPVATVANNGSGTAYEDYVQHPGDFKTVRHRISVAVSGGGAPSVTTRIHGVPA